MERNRETMMGMIARNCGCSRNDAERILQDELNVCREKLYGEGDLTMDDLEQVCMNVGIDFDEIEQLVFMI